MKIRLLLAVAASVEAVTFLNASKIATGVETPMTQYSLVGELVALNSQATISYRGLGEVRLLPVAASPPAVLSKSLAAPWVSVPVTPVLYSKVDAVAEPQFGIPVVYESPTFRHGKVDFMSGTELVRGSVNSPILSGAQTTGSRTIRIAHTGAQALDYFIEVGHPIWTRTLDPATSLSDTTITSYAPEQAKSKAAVDIYVNGLPVWVSERTFRFPQSSTKAHAAQLADFGVAVPAGGSTIVYLGRLSPGISLTITLVARGEAHAQDGCAPPAAFGLGTPKTLFADCYGLTDGVSWPENTPIEITARKPAAIVVAPPAQ